MKTTSLGSITVGRSFMKMTACCQGTGITLSDCLSALDPTVLCAILSCLFQKLNQKSFGKVCAKPCLPKSSLFNMLTGIRIVTQSMRLPKVTITLTVTTTMMSSLSTATREGHQRDGCFLPHLKVSPYLHTYLQHDSYFNLALCVSNITLSFIKKYQLYNVTEKKAF